MSVVLYHLWKKWATANTLASTEIYGRGKYSFRILSYWKAFSQTAPQDMSVIEQRSWKKKKKGREKKKKKTHQTVDASEKSM